MWLWTIRKNERFGYAHSNKIIENHGFTPCLQDSIINLRFIIKVKRPRNWNRFIILYIVFLLSQKLFFLTFEFDFQLILLHFFKLSISNCFTSCLLSTCMSMSSCISTRLFRTSSCLSFINFFACGSPCCIHFSH